MRLVRYLHELNQGQPCAATIGNFDGVHLGHQQVIQHVEQQAKLRGLVSTVISFEPLPAEYFRKPPPARIYPLRDKIRCLDEQQIERFVCLNFNVALATMSAEAFVQQVLMQDLQVRYLVVGDDFRFGAGRTGDYALLARMGAAANMQVVDTPTLLDAGQRVSSSLIRECLAKVDLPEAQRLLGRAYQLSGRVRHGNKLGRTLGFPTLNLRMPLNLALRRGVYIVRVQGLDTQTYWGIANLGQRPTVNGLDCRLEVHVLEFTGDAYGKAVLVEPIRFMRDEMRFASITELQTQIQQDLANAQQWISEQRR